MRKRGLKEPAPPLDTTRLPLAQQMEIEHGRQVERFLDRIDAEDTAIVAYYGVRVLFLGDQKIQYGCWAAMGSRNAQTGDETVLSYGHGVPPHHLAANTKITCIVAHASLRAAVLATARTDLTG